MDLRKEIKLSDLVPKRRPRKAGKKAEAKTKRKGGNARSGGSNVIVGLKVGATSISAAQIVNNGSKEVVRIARTSLPHGVVDGGEVRDPAALGKALNDFFSENSLPRRGVRLGISNNRIGVRVIEIAGIEEELQLDNAIGFRAHEMLSVPLEEAVIDHHVLSVQTEEDGSTIRKILLVVAYRDSVDRYLAATGAAKLELTGIDLEAFALLRAVGEPAGDGEAAAPAATTVVNIGHERSTLAVSEGGVCTFARVLDWGGGEIGTALGRALKIAPSEAESLKQELSLEPGHEGIEGLPAPRAAEAIEAVRYELQALVRDLLSSLRFHQSQPGSLAVGEILVTGGTATISGLAAELESELGIPVRLADPFARVRFADGVELPDNPGAYAVALGLGIED
jgi:type IV pilus assembly protein PilM